MLGKDYMPALLTPDERQKMFDSFVKGKKHANVNVAVERFLNDNHMILNGTTLQYARLKKVDMDGVVTLEPCPDLKFSVLNTELVP